MHQVVNMSSLWKTPVSVVNSLSCRKKTASGSKYFIIAEDISAELIDLVYHIYHHTTVTGNLLL